MKQFWWQPRENLISSRKFDVEKSVFNLWSKWSLKFFKLITFQTRRFNSLDELPVIRGTSVESNQLSKSTDIVWNRSRWNTGRHKKQFILSLTLFAYWCNCVSVSRVFSADFSAIALSAYQLDLQSHI